MQGLPSPPSGFAVKKAKILSQLAVPDAAYTDLSPKGSVDEGIRHLIAEINAIEGLVTTSSCAGRVSVFVEGRKTAGYDEAGDAQLAGVGGKGGGGNWLFVSHDPVEEDDAWIKELDFADNANASASVGSAGRRLVHFKFEPMVSLLRSSPGSNQLICMCRSYTF
jgi:tRNA wybutosine-synthesizing protein 3